MNAMCGLRSISSSNMSSRARGMKKFHVALDTAGLSDFNQNYLLVYTALTFFVVLFVYVVTKDWKGYTSPEEVDLGIVHVPSCRRKHLHTHSHSHTNG